MTYSPTTKYNLLYEMKRLKKKEDELGYLEEEEFSFDEYDIPYIIELIEKDIASAGDTDLN